MITEQQDFYLMCHIIGQEEDENCIQGFKSWQIPSRDQIIKNLSVSPERLSRIAETIWKNDGITCKRIHGNTDNNYAALSEKECNLLKYYILSLPTKPWPCELRNKATQILET